MRPLATKSDVLFWLYKIGFDDHNLKQWWLSVQLLLEKEIKHRYKDFVFTPIAFRALCNKKDDFWQFRPISKILIWYKMWVTHVLKRLFCRLLWVTMQCSNLGSLPKKITHLFLFHKNVCLFSCLLFLGVHILCWMSAIVRIVYISWVSGRFFRWKVLPVEGLLHSKCLHDCFF